jgi:hypothetical protein
MDDSTAISPRARQASELTKARTRLAKAQADITALRHAKAAGELVDRAAAERLIFARARLERDAWLAWCTRAAPELAGELQADERAVFVALDRLVRRHLEELARTPLDVLSHDRN